MGKRTLPLLLMALSFVLVFSFAGCIKDVSDGESIVSNEVSVGDVSVDSNSRKDAKDNLPEVDFDGREFVIFCRTEHKYEFTEDDTATEFINDAILKRNETVEERFGVEIKTFDINGNWGTHTEFFTTLRTYLNSGQDQFQLVAGYAAIIPSVISDGLFLNWKDIDYIDLSQPWWTSDLNDELTINNRLYLLTGDISLSLWENMCAMFYNKKIADEVDLPDLYEVVRKGEWTFDKMTEYAKLAALDNGDGIMTVDDRFGYISAKTTQIDVYQEAFDLSVTEKNDSGIPEFKLNNEKTYRTVNMLYEFICQSGNTYNTFSSDNQQYEMFGESKALFMPGKLLGGEYLNNYQIEYGILPMPKYDANQNDYYSTSIDNYSMIAVPCTVQDTDFVGIITEALCAESYRNVVEDYYQTILQGRYINDEDSAEMIDIIRKGLKFNFGYVYSYTLEWPAHQINRCINYNTANFASLWDSKVEIFEKNLEEHLKPYFH